MIYCFCRLKRRRIIGKRSGLFKKLISENSFLILTRFTNTVDESNTHFFKTTIEMYNPLRCESGADHSWDRNFLEFKKAGEIMLTRKLRNALQAIFLGVLLGVLCQMAIAGDQSQPAGKAAAKKSKASAESCDGALDIVPVKAMTFVRKRRPANSEPAATAGSKSEKRQSDRNKQDK